MKRILIITAAAIFVVAAFIYGAFVWVTDSYIDARYAAVLPEMDRRPLPQALSNALRLRMGDALARSLARNCFYPPSRTLGRALRELLVIYRFRQRFSESELLSLYGHTVFLGHTGTGDVIGFNNASRIYFGKDLNSLGPAEAVWLAVLAARPNYYRNHPDRAREDRDVLLRKMAERHLISASEEQRAEGEPVPAVSPAK